MRQIPLRFQEFTKTYSKVAAAYEQLAGECHRLGPLNERERALVKLGIAAGSNMEGSVHSQVRKALDIGMQHDEIRHAIILSMTAIGFPKMMAALTWTEDILTDPSK